MAEKTQSNDRAKRAFLAHMRHELRTPINAILGYSELLLEELQDGANHEHAADLTRINAAGKQLLTLVGAILDQSKIEAESDVDIGVFETEMRRNLRIPVTSVIGYADILIEDALAAGRHDLVPDLERIRSAAERLLSLMADILSLWQVQAGKKDLEVTASGGFQMVAEAIGAISSLERDRGLLPPLEGGALLLVDDNETNRDLLSRRLARDGHRVSVAENGRRALEMLHAEPFDLVLLDILMPEMNGYEVLVRLKADKALSHIPVIMLSALDDMDNVVRCIELGAEDYLPKPFNPVLLRARIGSCLEKKRRREREIAYLEQLRLERERSLAGLLGELTQGPAVIPGSTRLAERLRSAAESAAQNDLPVLILGEPGTETRTVAQMVHEKGHRSASLFLCLDCARVPAVSSESEEKGLLQELSQMSAIFGHQTGAFSFAQSNRAGYIELAQGGALLLENVDRLTATVQQRLLGFLQTGKACRLGSSQEVHLDVRMIASAHRSSSDASPGGELEQYLSSQLIRVPPLRERKRDLMAWVEHFVCLYSARLNKNVEGVTKEAMNLILAYDWPHNSEEMADVIQRGVRLADGPALTPEQIFIGLAPLESGKRPDLLQIPILRKVFESRLYPRAPQLLAVSGMALIMLSALLGPQSADNNVALVLAWGLLWPLLALGIPLTGRLFCAVCPLGATGRFFQGRWSFRRKVPPLIRKYGLYGAIVGFILIFWVEQVAGMEEAPRRLGFLLLTILSGSVVASIIFERAAWCRFMCPLGRMVGTYATLSSTELRTNPAVCKAECKTHGCYVGSERAGGCPMYEGAFALQSNEACKLCGDCLKSCPNRAIRLNLRPPVSEIWSLHQHSPALATFVPVLMATVLSFHWRGTDLYQLWFSGTQMEGLIYLGMILLISLVLGGAMALVTLMMRVTLREGLAWVPYAFLPLAFAGELGHQAAAFLSKAGAVLPTLDRQFGRGDLQLPAWGAPSATSGIQVAFLVLGTIASLYVCHRLVNRYRGTGRLQARLPVFLLAGILGLSYGVLFIIS